MPLAAGGGGANRRVTHLLRVRPPLGQYVAPEWAPPLDGRDAQKKTLRAYRRVADAVSASAAENDENEDEDSELEPSSNAASSAAGRQTGDTPPSPERGGGGGGVVTAGLTSFFQGLGLGGGVSARPLSGGARAPRAGERDARRERVAAKGDVARRKVHFESSAARVLLGFAGGDFELYVTMAPGTSRADAVAACNRLCTWLRQEEPRLFAAAA